LDGSGAPLVAVTIHIAVRGITRTLPVVAGPDGRFEAIFQPLGTEGGLYQISAGHPALPMPPAQDEFRLLGLALTPLPSVTVAEGGTTEADVTVANRTDIPLTGLTAEVITAHPSLAVSATLTTNTLAGSAQIGLRVSVTAVNTSAVESNVNIRVRSAEGVEAILTTRVRQEIRVPRLVATPVRLDAAMVRGRQTPVAFSIRNEGGIDTGPLSIAIAPAPWLSLSSPALLQSLPPLTLRRTSRQYRLTLQLQSLQKDVGDIEAECRRDEDVLRELELKDAAAAGGSVQVRVLLRCCSLVQHDIHSVQQAEAQLLLSSRRIRPLNQLGAHASQPINAPR
jgi:hypothetical protein